MHFKVPSRAILGLAVLGLALVATGAEATLIYGTSAAGEMSGSRSDGFGLFTNGGYQDNEPPSTIEWNILDLGGGQYDYTYTFIGFDTPSISHFILDLTDDCLDSEEAKAACVNNVDPDVPLLFGEYDGSNGNSEPGFPSGASIVGVKFDNLPDGTTSIHFLSNRAPVYGDFYLKGGNDSFAYNLGIDIHESSEDYVEFIARPNGLVVDNVVPEPASLLLLGGGLLGLALKRRRAR